MPGPVGEVADLSIGRVGSGESWCIVVIRSQQGTTSVEINASHIIRALACQLDAREDPVGEILLVN
jgi:coenzyme F420-reducing hydrogenase beta subunit